MHERSVVVAPKEWTDTPAPADRDRRVKELEAASTPTELKEKEEGVPVPAGAVGLVRLSWKGEHAARKDLSATLWMSEKGPGPTQPFEIRTILVGPVRSTSDVAYGEFVPGSAAANGLDSLLVLDANGVSVHARLLHSRLKEEANLFVLGEPVKLTEPELDRLRKDRKKWIGAGGLESADDPAPARAADPEGTGRPAADPANLPA